jgi:hypothetical protein
MRRAFGLFTFPAQMRGDALADSACIAVMGSTARHGALRSGSWFRSFSGTGRVRGTSRGHWGTNRRRWKLRGGKDDRAGFLVFVPTLI